MPQSATTPGRDALAWVCYLIHILVPLFILTGWAVRPLLVPYLVFVPVMVLQWRLNKGTCVLNNIESLLRTGRWRNPANPEEGAWLKTLINDVTGLKVTVRQADLISYGVMITLWCLALWHLLGW